MPKRTIQLSFFIVLTLLLFVLSFFILKPYLGIVFLATVLSVIFYPVYQNLSLLFKGRKSLAAISTLLVIVFVIVIPVTFIVGVVFNQAIDLYNAIAFGENSYNIAAVNELVSSTVGNYFLNDASFTINLQDYLKDVLGWIISHFDSFFAAVFKGVLGFFLMLLSIYYILRNSEKIKNQIVLWSPLPDNYDEEILLALKSSIDAIFRGRFLVSVAQGFFISVGFLIFGVPDFVLWGFVGSIASLIPVLGTSIITLPAVIYLFLNGNTGAGIGLLIWAAVAIGFVDDLLTFFVMKGKTKIHPLVILLSILGGMRFFGPIGFIAGPVAVSAFIALARIYPFLMYKGEIPNETS